MDEEGGEKSFNIQLLKYNIEFNKQEELTIVPSVGKIIISLFRAIFPLLLIVVWWEIDIFSTPSGRASCLAPISSLHNENFFFHFASFRQSVEEKNGEKKVISIWWFLLAADSVWRTIAIRNKLNVNRRHDGTFMKATLNSPEASRGSSAKHAFDLWKRLINFLFYLFPFLWANGEMFYALKSFQWCLLQAKFMLPAWKNCSNSRSTSDLFFYRVREHRSEKFCVCCWRENLKTRSAVLCLSRN